MALPTQTRQRSMRPIVAVSVLVALPLAALAFVLAAAGVASAVPEREELEEIRDELDAIADELEEAREAVDAEEAALEVAEERVEEVFAAVRRAEEAVERQQRVVETARDELEELEAEVATHEDRIADRVARLYKDGALGSVEPLLQATDPEQALAASALVDALNRSDQEAFESLDATRAAAEAQADLLVEEEQLLSEVLREQEALLAEAQELREDQAMQLAAVEAELDELESHERYLEDEEADLAAAVREAERAAERREQARATGGGSSAETAQGGSDQSSGAQQTASGGGWTWPAHGPITSGFGQRWGRLHAGIDIAGGHGSSIMAARPGSVAHAGWMGGYGNTIILDHGGGVTTVYAHLTSIEVGVGQSVGAGQRIGGMGCTGSCTGTHLHFEIRVSGNPQNPMGYLP